MNLGYCFYGDSGGTERVGGEAYHTGALLEDAVVSVGVDFVVAGEDAADVVGDFGVLCGENLHAVRPGFVEDDEGGDFAGVIAEAEIVE